MATAAEPHVTVDSEVNRFVLHDVSWEDYEAMLRIVGNRPIRVTYDRGELEALSPIFAHESYKYLLGRLIGTLAEELDIPIEGGGSTTLKRQSLAKGAEPDECYWLGERAAQVCGKQRLDLEVDPVPDLAVEIDITRSSVPRIGIFASLGIPEVWRFDGKVLSFLHRADDGEYHARTSSRNFPDLTTADIVRFLDLARTHDKTAWAKAFRKFIHDELLPRRSPDL